MRTTSETIGKYVEKLTKPVTISKASADLGLSNHPQAAMRQVSAAFNYYKKIGNDFICGLIASKITSTKGDYPYKRK